LNQCITESGATRLRGNSLKKKLASQQFVLGTFLEIPSPVLVELLGLAGFDFVIIDREHGPIDWGQTENLIRAGVSTGISIIVRPPNSEATAVAQPLDWGAAGIQVPQVASAEMARQVVHSSKYHPLGMRGLQPYVRAASYHAHETNQYLANANEESTIIAQVEGVEGIENLDSILQVEGLDIAFVGPYDLSQALGIPAQVKDTRVREAMAGAVQSARKAGKSVGTYCDDVESAKECLALGVSYLAVSIDAYIFLSGARSIISKLRP
jgi:4-hydroxy-2-oxoheptanedioate aldolase